MVILAAQEQQCHSELHVLLVPLEGRRERLGTVGEGVRG